MPGGRVVVVDALDVVGVQVPWHFRCPISLELMRDPVTVCTGQTYDRSSIESWVATGNTTCPVTRSPLTDFSLIPNHTLRRLIQDWCVSHSSHGIERIPTPKQPADPSLLRHLLSQLSSPHLRLSSLRRLRHLARDSDHNRSLLSSLPLRDHLLSLLFTHHDSDSNSNSNSNNHFEQLTHESLALLALFPLTDPHQCDSLASHPDRIQFLTSLLTHSSVDVRVDATSLIESVLSGTSSLELRAIVGNADGLVEGIVGILKIVEYPRALKVGIKALFALSLVKQNRNRAVSAGAPEGIVNRLGEFDKCDAERALATVELLCRVPSGCAAFAGHALTVPLLVKIILKVSDRATEYAAGALLSLCSVAVAGEEVRREAVAAGVVTQLLLLVQSECTVRAKRKAQTLLKMLRDLWAEDSVANSDDFGCTDVLPF
ncbi:hypothetical protein Sjap_022465 [Stephania japonica]|uniref:U-box domain-containing protein n=1 Tax=Stephania japonica TaxID=461633 RepID=A0AAP0EW75_9MAGN